MAIRKFFVVFDSDLAYTKRPVCVTNGRAEALMVAGWFRKDKPESLVHEVPLVLFRFPSSEQDECFGGDESGE